MMNSNGGSYGGCVVHKVVKVLLLVGGLNWGLVGAGMLMSKEWNVVHMLFSSMPKLEAVVYLLVGVAAVIKIVGCRCSKCMEACGTCQPGGSH